MSILDQYQAILLDMNSTFMFGEDRFGVDEDFYKTYMQVGGSELAPAVVDRAIRNCYAGMMRDYEDPARYDNFPALQEGLLQYGGVKARDVEHLSSVFARHEMGTVSPAYAKLLRAWSKTHRLGVLSNIWADKSPWLAEFRRAGIGDIWHSVVFSSDSRNIKPSLTIYNKTLDTFGVAASDILFIGDSIRVDIEPAKALGMSTVWLTDTDNDNPMVDYVARSLLELEAMQMS